MTQKEKLNQYLEEYYNEFLKFLDTDNDKELLRVARNIYNFINRNFDLKEIAKEYEEKKSFYNIEKIYHFGKVRHF